MERKVIPTSSTSFTLSTYFSMNDGCRSDFFQQVTLLLIWVHATISECKSPNCRGICAHVLFCSGVVYVAVREFD